MRSGVVLYGPPASGKDTITEAAGEEYALVPRLKAGPGRTAGYRTVTTSDLDTYRAIPGEVLWETQRYSASYMLTKSEVIATAESAVPVVHVGQAAAVEAVATGVPELHWTVVDLRCPRDVAASRVATRGTGDDTERMAIYDATPPLESADRVIDTSAISPDDAAQIVKQAVTGAQLVIPAPTFRDGKDTLDLDVTERYARLLSTSPARYVLVNGPMGGGERMSVDARGANLAEWVRHIPPRRIITACWTTEDVTAAQRANTQPLVMLQAADPDELDQQLTDTPRRAWVYANPRYSTALVTPEIAAHHQIDGIKLSKVDAADLRAIRAAVPNAKIMHGSSRNIEGSIDAGADLVTAPPLAASAGVDLAADIQTIQRHVNAVQAILDQQASHEDRVAWIGTVARGFTARVQPPSSG